MAQRHVPTRDEQQDQDERVSTQLFLNSVGQLTERDESLTREESSTLMGSVQDAEEQAGVFTENEDVFKCIGDEFDIIVEEVDAVVEKYSKQLDKIIECEDTEAMSQGFLQVGKHLFHRGITTLRIFVLLRFGYKLVQRFFLKVKRGLDRYLGKEVTDFIVLIGTFLVKTFLTNRVLPWVREHGGWNRVLSLVNWGALAVCTGVVLIGIGVWKLSSGAIEN